MNQNAILFCLICFVLPIGLVIAWQAKEGNLKPDISPRYGQLLYFTTSGG